MLFMSYQSFLNPTFLRLNYDLLAQSTMQHVQIVTPPIQTMPCDQMAPFPPLLIPYLVCLHAHVFV